MHDDLSINNFTLLNPSAHPTTFIRKHSKLSRTTPKLGHNTFFQTLTWNVSHILERRHHPHQQTLTPSFRTHQYFTGNSQAI